MNSKIIFILIFSSGFISAQPDTIKTFHINDFRIEAVKGFNEYGILKKKTHIYKNLNMVRIYNDTFAFSSEDSKVVPKFTAKEIKKISIKDGNYLLSGAGYSALGGFALGFILGSVSKGKGEGHPSYSFEGPEFGLALGLLLGLSTGIIGGIFGAITPYYEDFDLSKNGFDNNSDELMDILDKFSNN